MTIPQWNFNTHPELSDEDFAKALHSVYFGTNTMASTSVTDATNFISANGRYQLYMSWVNPPNSFPGNKDDEWLANLPPWFPLALTLVGALAAVGIGAALYWKDIKAALAKAKSGSSNNGD